MRKDVTLAILRMDASPSKKILARTILANYEAEEISSVNFWEWVDIPKPLVITKETLRGKPLDVEFVEEASFFYGMTVEKIEQFRKDCYDSSHSTWDQSDTDWYQVDVEEEEPCHYDMVLINGRFWTFAPNLPEILEVAIF